MSLDALAVAVEAARAGAAVVRRALDRSDPAGRVVLKGPVDPVTEVDLASEEAIRAVLDRESPGVPVLAEEGGGAAAGDRRWIVDPLDGTVNFVRGFPAFCVSVALEEGGRVVAGCIADPLAGVAYRASLGGGAWCGDRRLRVSPTASLDEALLLTGFPYDRRQRAAHYLRHVEAFLRRARGIRRCGSAALDLVHVAAGRADGFWEFGLQAWDVAAGRLLVEEAGGRVTDMDGGPLDLDRPRLLATNGRVHAAMRDVLASLLSSDAAHHPTPQE